MYDCSACLAQRGVAQGLSHNDACCLRASNYHGCGRCGGWAVCEHVCGHCVCNCDISITPDATSCASSLIRVHMMWRTLARKSDHNTGVHVVACRAQLSANVVSKQAGATSTCNRAIIPPSKAAAPNRCVSQPQDPETSHNRCNTGLATKGAIGQLLALVPSHTSARKLDHHCVISPPLHIIFTVRAPV